MTGKMSSTRRTVRIVCDAPSHAPKVADVDWFRVTTYDDGHVTVMRHNYAADRTPDAVVNLDPRDAIIPRSAWGDSRTAPDEERPRARSRYALECPLCGLRVPLRDDRAAQVFGRLVAEHVSRVTLSGLAANL